MPRNQLNRNERRMFDQRRRQHDLCVNTIERVSGMIMAHVPAGLVNDDADQDLAMNIDLSTTDRHCKMKINDRCVVTD
jgi:hypothetical protein